MQLPASPSILLLYALLLRALLSSTSAANQFHVDGTVIELDESNFDSAISSLDYVLVDFYAPWCGHCNRLAPELDAAAPVLARLREPIVIAKIDADKYRRLSGKYEIDGFPTLKLFIHGVPIDYSGPRKAESLVRFLKKFVAPDLAILDSDTTISQFVEDSATYFPIYIGFGLEEAVISKLAIKYKNKAWFAAAKGFSDSLMQLYDFDKVPALVSLHPKYDESTTFYGPFDDEFLESFIKQNMLPSCVPINLETLELLKDDKRKIVLTVVEDENNEKSKELIKLLKPSAAANRDLLFAYVGLKQWEDFARTFNIGKKSKLPIMVVWDGNEEYFSVIGCESIMEEDQGHEITRFLAGFREGKTEAKKISGPSFLSFINSFVGLKLVFIIVFVVAVLMLIQTIGNVDDDDSGVSTHEAGHVVSRSSSLLKSTEAHQIHSKED